MFGAVKKEVVRTEREGVTKAESSEHVGLGELIMEMHIYFPAYTLDQIMRMSFPLLRMYAAEIDFRFQRDMWFASVASMSSIRKLF